MAEVVDHRRHATLALVIVTWLVTYMPLSWFDWTVGKSVLIPVYVGCLVWDFVFQMGVLESNSITKMTARNGDVVTLEDFGNGASVLTHQNRSGETFSRTCQGECDGKTVGPKPCLPGKSPSLDCGANPPEINCV